MKKITKTYEVFSFDELTEEVKEKVIEKFRDINVDYYWSSDIEENTAERLEELGYSEPKLFWSGFWSQGDGASFSASGNIEKLVPKKYQKFIESIDFTKNGRYEHEYTMSIDIDYNDKPTGRIGAMEFRNLEKELIENAREEARIFYDDLKTEYEYQTKDSCVIEAIKANEYQFLADGTLIEE